MFLQRRKDIYRVCQKHDIIIIEDEPYYFLQMEPYQGKPTLVPDISSSDLIRSLVPSFMSLDGDGRVLRLDSLSKVSLLLHLTNNRLSLPVFVWLGYPARLSSSNEQSVI